ncbi:MAG TPA: DUF2058 domain-containing protein [Steroidobacteraceae bacterium]|nr:DUF2058 domain-containing protein [Steroidobacteraceae bacterium]
MSLSLREQLLQAGLVGSKQAKKAEQEVRQQQRKHRDASSPNQQQNAVQKAQAEKAARDKELNRKRDEERQRQARLAEIRQIVEQNRLPRIESDEYFNFVHRNKIHRIAVDASLRERITSGQVVLVRYGKFYAPVLPDIAEKVRERDADSIVDLNAQLTAQTDSTDDDPYKDFAVPDDLMW